MLNQIFVLSKYLKILKVFFLLPYLGYFDIHRRVLNLKACLQEDNKANVRLAASNDVEK